MPGSVVLEGSSHDALRDVGMGGGGGVAGLQGETNLEAYDGGAQTP